MAINVLGIAGSPEIGGNTEILLDRVLDGCGAGVVKEKIVVSELAIRPCTSCRSCAKTGECRVDDDMQSVYAKLVWANRIIVASPVYFMSVTAQMKAVIDRCQMFWERKYHLNRPITTDEADDQSTRRGIVIATAGEKKSGMFECLLKVVNSFFVTLDIGYDGGNSLLFDGIEGRRDVLEHTDYLDAAYSVGQRVATW